MVTFRSAPFSTRHVDGIPVSRTTCVPNGTSLLVNTPASPFMLPPIPVDSTATFSVSADADPAGRHPDGQSALTWPRLTRPHASGHTRENHDCENEDVRPASHLDRSVLDTVPRCQAIQISSPPTKRTNRGGRLRKQAHDPRATASGAYPLAEALRPRPGRDLARAQEAVGEG